MVSHLEILLEEPSAEVALKVLLPKILPPEVECVYHVFSGKTDLMRKLPARLRAYSMWLPPDYRIVVLVDRDRDDCKRLKTYLETQAIEAGLITRTNSPTGAFQILNRIVVEELEAWFLGDLSAVCQAYPKHDWAIGSTPSLMSCIESFPSQDYCSGIFIYDLPSVHLQLIRKWIVLWKNYPLYSVFIEILVPARGQIDNAGV